MKPMVSKDKRPVNLDIGQTYLDKLLGEETMENNLIKALASYNAGPGNVKRWAREIGRAQDPLLFLESMRAPETRLYVQKVMYHFFCTLIAIMISFFL